jgi:hypothetical protein
VEEEALLPDRGSLSTGLGLSVIRFLAATQEDQCPQSSTMTLVCMLVRIGVSFSIAYPFKREELTWIDWKRKYDV